MKKLIIPIVASVFLFSGCNSDKENTEVVTQVEVNVDQSSPITDFVSSQHDVILETNDSCIVNSVNRVLVEDGVLYVQDGKKIFSFSEEGQYLKTYKSYGQGPEEYLELTSFRIYGPTLYVLDQNSSRLLVYSLEDGSFTRELKLPYKFVDFWIESEERVAFASGNFNSSMNNFVWINSLTGEICSSELPYNQYNTVLLWDYLPFAGKIKDNLIVNVPFGMSNYRLTKSDSAPYMKFHFNTKVQLPEVAVEDINILELSEKTKNIFAVRQLGYFAHTDEANYLSFRLFGLIGGLMSHLVKFDGNGNQIAQTMIGAEIFEEYPYLLGIHSVIEDKIVSVSQSETLLRIDENLGTTYWKDKGLTEESNPVISFYTLK